MRIGPIIGEIVRALAVLALVFLNFAHAPLASAAAGDVVGMSAALDSYCGDAAPGDDRAHAPCHACRIGSGADLPPTPVCVRPGRTLESVRHVVDVRIALAAPTHAWPAARAPPDLA